MTIRSIALQGIGYSALLVALQGFPLVDDVVGATGSGGAGGARRVEPARNEYLYVRKKPAPVQEEPALARAELERLLAELLPARPTVKPEAGLDAVALLALPPVVEVAVELDQVVVQPVVAKLRPVLVVRESKKPTAAPAAEPLPEPAAPTPPAPQIEPAVALLAPVEEVPEPTAELVIEPEAVAALEAATAAAVEPQATDDQAALKRKERNRRLALLAAIILQHQ